VPQFNHKRLEVARKRRGLTKTKLAEKAGVSTRSLTKFDREGYQPGEETVDRLAAALGFPSAFFFGDDLDEPSVAGSSFRALSKATARQKDEALSSGTLSMRLEKWIESHFSLPTPDVPTYQHLDPDTAAEAVRDLWGLGQRPIRNVIHLLEAHGVRVFSLPPIGREVDGFSVWHGDTPFVFLNTTKTAERSRMDAAHELGHLVLHAHGGPKGRKAEDEAYAFGAAFLMPEQTVLAEIPHGASLKRLIKEKKRWRVAAINLARRAYTLNLITEWQYRSICIELGKQGKNYEPQPMKERETSQVLNKVFQGLKEEGISKGRVAGDLAIPVEEKNQSVFGLLRLHAIDGDNEQTSTAKEPEASGRPRLRVVT